MFSRQQLGVDLGSSWVRISARGKGIVLREPSTVALAEEARVVAAGSEAVRKVEDAPEAVTAVRPLRDGFAADYDLTAAMLRAFLKQGVGALGRFSSPDVILSISSGASDAEKEAALRAAQEVARHVSLIPAPFAAALGADLGVRRGASAMIVHIGGSVTDIAVIRDGETVAAEPLRAAGYEFDEAIVRLARSKAKLLIGEHTAEEVKLELGAVSLSTSEPATEKTIRVRGRDVALGTPKTAHLNAREVADALREPLRKIAAGVRRVLETVPPDVAADVISGSVTLTGGGARLPNSAEFLHQQTGLPVRLAGNPADCAVLGASRAFEHPSHALSESPSSSDEY